ncbi:hypothetical protein KCP75_02030 [Salmonella enterica subsp. enterica]|nr:hypothetical protein KCP75_02030 [Salmonella enterica subsp. enterica]
MVSPTRGQRRADGAITESWVRCCPSCIGGVHQRPHVFHHRSNCGVPGAAVRQVTTSFGISCGEHICAIEFGVERVGNRRIACAGCSEDDPIRSRRQGWVNDNSGSGHFLLHVIDTASSAE